MKKFDNFQFWLIAEGIKKQATAWLAEEELARKEGKNYLFTREYIISLMTDSWKATLEHASKQAIKKNQTIVNEINDILELP